MSKKQANSFEEEKKMQQDLPEVNFIHQQVKNMELDKPSMLFTSQVMAQVMALKNKLVYKPLLSKRTWAVIGSLWLALIVYASSLGTNAIENPYLNSLDKYLKQSPLNFWNLMSNVDGAWIFWLILSPLLLWGIIILDTILKKIFLKPKGT